MIIIEEGFEIIEFEICVDIGFDIFVEVKEDEWISDDNNGNDNGCVFMVVVWIFDIGCAFVVVLWMLEIYVDFIIGIVLSFLMLETNVDFKVGIVLSFLMLEINVDFKVGVVLFIWVLETNVVFGVRIVVFIFKVDVDSDLISPGTSYFTILSSVIPTKSNVGTLFI